jgi:hypothetical protein
MPAGALDARSPDAFTPAPSYIGTTADARVLGTPGRPDTSHDAAALWQKVSGTTTPGNNSATFTSIIKTTAARGANASGAFIEASDDAGGRGTFTEGLDARCFLRAEGGTCGNVLFSATDAGIASFGNLIGSESFIIDNTGVDQPPFAGFEPDHLVAAFVASNGGPTKGDAGFVVNGNNAAPFRTGFLAVGRGVGSGTGADDTAFATKGDLRAGLDMTASRFAALAIATRGFQVDPAGHVVAVSYRGTLRTPASSKAPCTPGDTTDDADYHYVCVGPSHWRRVALTDF